MSDNTELQIPDELAMVFADFEGCLAMRDKYIRISFRLSVKASKQAERYRSNFWNGVYKLYPNTEAKILRYNKVKRVLQTINPEADQ